MGQSATAMRPSLCFNKRSNADSDRPASLGNSSVIVLQILTRAGTAKTVAIDRICNAEAAKEHNCRPGIEQHINRPLEDWT